MKNLKINILILILVLHGCSTSAYKATDNNGLNEITATADRFLPYCEKVVKDDGTMAFGFMILFLDEEKTVGAVAGMLTSETACLQWKSDVERIMDTRESIILIGFGNMKEPRTAEKFSYRFDKHGTFYGNGRSFDFFSIRNNLGQCFSTYRSRCP